MKRWPIIRYMLLKPGEVNLGMRGVRYRRQAGSSERRYFAG